MQLLYRNPILKQHDRVQSNAERVIVEPDAPRTHTRDDDDTTAECIREISRRETRGSSMIAVARLFGTSRAIVVDKSSIYPRGEHAHTARIAGMFNPLFPRNRWAFAAVSLIGYAHAYYTAYDVAFGPATESVWLLVLDQLVNAMFVAEAWVQCHTALYLASSDVFVADRRFIRDRCLSLKLLPRIVHIAPLELFHFCLVPSSVPYTRGVGLRMLRLFKLIRIKQMFLQKENQSFHAIDRKRTWANLFAILTRFACVSHLIACCVYGLSRLDPAHSNVSFFGRVCNTWGFDAGCHDGQHTGWLYIVCLYYAVTITSTVGFGNVLPYTTIQLLAHICFVVIGAAHNAIIIAKVVETVQEFSREQRRYADALSSLDDFTETRNISESLRNEMKRHFDYQWARTRCVDERAFLKADMSHTIRHRVAHALYLQVVKRSARFASVPEPCILALVLDASAQFVRKNEFVFTPGLVASAVYVVLKGALVEYTNETMHKPLGTFEKYGCFGMEAVNDGGAVHKTAVRAETNSDVLCISRESLARATILYPALYDTLTSSTATHPPSTAPEDSPQTE